MIATKHWYAPIFALMAISLMPALAADEGLTADRVQLTLPPVIYAVPEVETNIFFDNIVLDSPAAPLTFQVSSALGSADNTRWTITPGTADVGRHALTVSVFDDSSTLIAAQSTVLQVSSKTAGVHRKLPVRLLIIGDSLTHASAWPNALGRHLSGPGNPAWRMLGTHHPASAAEGIFHEGYGGWTWQRFADHFESSPDGTPQKRSSPFVFLNEDGTAALNMDRYIADYCDGLAPDFFIIMLGINDCFSVSPDDVALIHGRIDVVFAHADRLLTAIQSAAPQAHIGMCLTTPPNSRQAAFQANYQDRYSRDGWKRIQHLLVQRQLQFVQRRQDSQLSVVPTELNLDPVEGYPENNGVHPDAHGYNQIGASVYAWLKYRMQFEENAAAQGL